LGNQHQIDYYNNIAEETALPIVRRETTATFNEIPQTQTEHKTNVSQQVSITNQTQNVLTVCSSSQFLLSALNKRSSILDLSLASSFSIVSLILRCSSFFLSLDKNKSESNQQEVSQEQDLQPLNNDIHGEKKTVHGISNDINSQQQQLPRSDFSYSI
jgi:hypothetical protein